MRLSLPRKRWIVLAAVAVFAAWCWNAYYRPLFLMFPTARYAACNVEDGIDWSVVNTSAKLEECVFMVADKVRDLDILMKWMVMQGFHGFSRGPVDAVSMRISYGVSESGRRMSASLGNFEKTMFFLERMLAYGLTVGIVFDQKINPIDISSGYSRT